MCDGDNAHAALFSLVHNDVPNLCLCDNVQHGAYLVADEKIGAAHKRAGNAEALQFTAGKLAGVAVQPFLFYAEGGQHVLTELAALFKHAAQLPAGIDCLFGVLINKLYRANAFLGQGCAVEKHLTRFRPQITCHYHGKRTFAVAAGGEKSHNLAAFYGEILIFQNEGGFLVIAEVYILCLK